jgi:TonB family protein
VVVSLLIDEEGHVANARVLKPLDPRLDKATLAVVSRLRFSPARVGGKAVQVRIPYTFTFVLD